MSYPSVEERLAPKPVTEQRLGRYRLAYELASGGMGSVYLARAAGPAGFEKLVALKRIHPHMASDARFMSMFLDEAQIAARIQHPNVCSVIDFGEVDGNYFLTMPYIMGESLNRVIRTVSTHRNAPIAAEFTLIATRLIADACEGLHAAHELRDEGGGPLDVVHRDVSPQNLMVGYDGMLRVLDFGVASARHRHYQTSTGEVKGKFAYLAPEQIEGQPVDRRADVWALGVVLWEAITARRLFARDTMAATVRAVCDSPIPSIQEARPEAPAGLQAVVDKALARDKDARYPTARAMGKDLLAVLAREGRFVTSPDVAEWMVQAFPDGLRAQEMLVEQTRTGDLDTGSLERAMADSGVASVVQRREPSAPLDLTTRLDEGSFPTGASGPLDLASARAEPVPAAPRRPGGALMVVAGVGVLGVLAALVAGFAVWLFGAPAQEMVATEMVATEVDPSPANAEAPVEAQVAEAQVAEAQVAEAQAAEAQAAEAQAARAGSDEREAQAAPTAALTEPDAVGGAVAPSPPAREEPTEEPEAAPERRAQHAPRPRAVPQRPLAPGRLTVATPGGWGMVYLGSRQLGEAPGVFTLPAGRHTISIAPFGRSSRIRRTVVVPENGTVPISVPL